MLNPYLFLLLLGLLTSIINKGGNSRRVLRFAAIVADKEVFVYLGFQEFDLISLKVNLVKWMLKISLVGFI